MQTPSQLYPLEPLHYSENAPEDGLSGLCVQSIVYFDLKEEGNHVLAVNVSYTETSLASSPATSRTSSPDFLRSPTATGGRIRTFRKLYQFLAMPCLSVRTKASELVAREVDDKSLGPYGKAKMLRYALEAQLENVGEGVITLESTTLTPQPPFISSSLNITPSNPASWPPLSPTTPSSPIKRLPLPPLSKPSPDTIPTLPLLPPRSVVQLLFLLEQEHLNKNGLEELQKAIKRDGGRIVLGQLSIEWRNGMGEKGYLCTGGLMSKKR